MILRVRGIKAWIYILIALIIIIVVAIAAFHIILFLLPLIILIFLVSYFFKMLNKVKKGDSKGYIDINFKVKK